MQKFEAIIAETEASNKNEPKNKTRTLKTAATTSIPTLAPTLPVIKRNYSNSSSSNATLTNSIDGDDKDGLNSENIIRNSANSDTIHYNPNEKENIGSVDEDGVIRLTLTPAVCR